MSTHDDYDITSPVPPTDPAEYERWLDGIIRMPEAARLRGGVHPDTVKKAARAKGELLQLGARAVGVRRRFALMLPDQRQRRHQRG